MTTASSNVFRGANALRDYYDPDKCPPLPLVELPDSLNPYRRSHGVHIYAKLMTALPASNVKSLPALNMLMRAGAHIDPHHNSGVSTPPEENSDDDDESPSVVNTKSTPSKPHTIVEYSSGSTAISLGIIGRIFGIPNAHTYISNKTSATKIALLRFFGLQLTLFGGPSQPLPDDPRGGIAAARTLGIKDPGTLNPDQYTNTANYEAHARWTGPQIVRQLPEVTMFAAGMGTAGTLTGTALHLKEFNAQTYCLGVCTSHGQRVPGPRTAAMLAPVTFPFRNVVDGMEDVDRKAAFASSLQLCRMGILAGPSSGLALQGVLQHVERHIRDGTLARLQDATSQQVHCVFICCDLPYQYVDEYFDTLGDAYFPKVRNDVLIGSDAYRYDDAWELSEQEGDAKLQDVNTIVLDLRQRADELLHVTSDRIIRLPLASSSPSSQCPFTDATLLDAQWRELDARLDVHGNAYDVIGRTQQHDVVCLCDTRGGTARVATSVLRQHGVAAFSISGGGVRK